jgi:2-dehydro-3-deoxygluconokinase
MTLVVGFGEVMVRISPTGPESFGDSQLVQFTAGGSEANVLAKLGHLSPAFGTQLITSLRDDLAGRALGAELCKYRVGLDHVRWTNAYRNGVYYLEQGIGPIVARVDYDREGSAIANLAADEGLFDVLDGASAYFLSGITPALSDACRLNSAASLARARKHNVPVFFDVNYRKKLWSARDAQKTIEAYLREGLITALITTETDARTVFGIDRDVDDQAPIATLIERSRQVLEDLKARFRDNCQLYVLTIRKRITNETGQWTSAALLPDGSCVVGDVFDYVILDRPGAGDACSAGLIAGYLGLKPDGSMADGAPLKERVQHGLNLGNRMAIVAQKTVGDMGPAWPVTMYFNRVSESKEISR